MGRLVDMMESLRDIDEIPRAGPEVGRQRVAGVQPLRAWSRSSRCRGLVRRVRVSWQCRRVHSDEHHPDPWKGRDCARAGGHIPDLTWVGVVDFRALDCDAILPGICGLHARVRRPDIQKGHIMTPQELGTHIKGIHNSLDKILEAHQEDGKVDHLPSEHPIHRHLHGILHKLAAVYGYQTRLGGGYQSGSETHDPDLGVEEPPSFDELPARERLDGQLRSPEYSKRAWDVIKRLGKAHQAAILPRIVRAP